jgi:16S rRNA processing protein RimM
MQEHLRAGERTAESALLVGRIRKPHGIRGDLFVWTETDRPEAVFQPGRRLLLGDDAGRLTGEALTVERARPFKDGVLLKTVEYTTRAEPLEQLRGQTLYIRRDEAAPLAEDEVFYHDLIGLRVVAHGEPVGVVREVYETPGADLLVVRRGAEGSAEQEVLIPFVRDMIRRLDLGEGILEIEPPEGLLEL